MNKVILMGRLVKDPEVYYSKSEVPITVARYTLAVRNTYNKNNENDAEFINVVAFKNSGEFAAKYFKKGTMIVVDGRIHQGEWEDADHVKHSRYEVIAETQHFAGDKRVSRENDHVATSRGEIASSKEVDRVEDDLPY